jgi:hypothetical protein
MLNNVIQFPAPSVKVKILSIKYHVYARDKQGNEILIKDCKSWSEANRILECTQMDSKYTSAWIAY